MRHILSRQNPEIKNVYALRLSKERTGQKLFIAEGTRAVITLLQSNAHVHTIYVTEKNLEHISSHLNEKNICVVSSHVMEKISQAATPSGILGVFEMPPEPKPELLSCGMVLAHIGDPGNMGTLIRTAAAMNISSTVVVEGADPWSFKVVQSSAGFITHVNIFQWSWQQLIAHAKEHNLACAALVVSGGTTIETLSKERTLLVIGSEAHGIPQDWLAECTTQITLKMPGHIESLNAAIAGSIALYLVFGQ